MENDHDHNHLQNPYQRGKVGKVMELSKDTKRKNFNMKVLLCSICTYLMYFKQNIEVQNL